MIGELSHAFKRTARSYARDRVIRKQLPADLGGGAIFCSPDALLSTWKPGWQSEQTLELFEWARRYVKPGDVVWDIGANQGLFSFAALAVAGPTGHVIALEPDPFLSGLLHRTRRMQAVQSRIEILPIAVSADAGVMNFSVAAKDRALNHLTSLKGNPHTGGERDRFAVVTVTLDWLAAHMPAPNLVKVDVEGGELGVLMGAGSDLLQRIRPTWIIEVAEENAAAIAKILRDANYRMFDASAPGTEMQQTAWNTLAVPAEAV